MAPQNSPRLTDFSHELLCHILQYLPLKKILSISMLCKKLLAAVDMHLRLCKEIDLCEGKIYDYMPSAITDDHMHALLKKCPHLEVVYGLHPLKVERRRLRKRSALTVPGIIEALSLCCNLKSIETSDLRLLEAIMHHLPQVDIIGHFQNRDGVFPPHGSQRLKLQPYPRISSLHLIGVEVPELTAMPHLHHLHLQCVRFTKLQPFRAFLAQNLKTFVMKHCMGPSLSLRYLSLIIALSSSPNLTRLELVRVPLPGGLFQRAVEDSYRHNGFVNLKTLVISGCKGVLESDLGHLMIVSSKNLESIAIQPSLTRDSLFVSLSFANCAFPKLKSLHLGFVDKLNAPGEWTNDTLVSIGLAEVPDTPSSLTDSGMKVISQLFPNIKSMSVSNCPHLMAMDQWSAIDGEQVWKELNDLTLQRCHCLQLPSFALFLAFLPKIEVVILNDMFREPPKGCSHVGLSAGTGLGMSSAVVSNQDEHIAVQGHPQEFELHPDDHADNDAMDDEFMDGDNAENPDQHIMVLQQEFFDEENQIARAPVAQREDVAPVGNMDVPENQIRRELNADYRAESGAESSDASPLSTTDDERDGKRRRRARKRILKSNNRKKVNRKRRKKSDRSLLFPKHKPYLSSSDENKRIITSEDISSDEELVKKKPVDKTSSPRASARDVVEKDLDKPCQKNCSKGFDPNKPSTSKDGNCLDCSCCADSEFKEPLAAEGKNKRSRVSSASEGEPTRKKFNGATTVSNVGKSGKISRKNFVNPSSPLTKDKCKILNPAAQESLNQSISEQVEVSSIEKDNCLLLSVDAQEPESSDQTNVNQTTETFAADPPFDQTESREESSVACDKKSIADEDVGIKPKEPKRFVQVLISVVRESEPESTLSSPQNCSLVGDEFIFLVEDESAPCSDQNVGSNFPVEIKSSLGSDPPFSQKEIIQEKSMKCDESNFLSMNSDLSVEVESQPEFVQCSNDEIMVGGDILVETEFFSSEAATKENSSNHQDISCSLPLEKEFHPESSSSNEAATVVRKDNSVVECRVANGPSLNSEVSVVAEILPECVSPPQIERQVNQDKFSSKGKQNISCHPDSQLDCKTDDLDVHCKLSPPSETVSSFRKEISLNQDKSTQCGDEQSIRCDLAGSETVSYESCQKTITGSERVTSSPTVELLRELRNSSRGKNVPSAKCDSVSESRLPVCDLTSVGSFINDNRNTEEDSVELNHPSSLDATVIVHQRSLEYKDHIYCDDGKKSTSELVSRRETEESANCNEMCNESVDKPESDTSTLSSRTSVMNQCSNKICCSSESAIKLPEKETESTEYEKRNEQSNCCLLLPESNPIVQETIVIHDDSVGGYKSNDHNYCSLDVEIKSEPESIPSPSPCPPPDPRLHPGRRSSDDFFANVQIKSEPESPPPSPRREVDDQEAGPSRRAESDHENGNARYFVAEVKSESESDAVQREENVAEPELPARRPNRTRIIDCHCCFEIKSEQESDDTCNENSDSVVRGNASESQQHPKKKKKSSDTRCKMIKAEIESDPCGRPEVDKKKTPGKRNPPRICKRARPPLPKKLKKRLGRPGYNLVSQGTQATSADIRRSLRRLRTCSLRRAAPESSGTTRSCKVSSRQVIKRAPKSNAVTHNKSTSTSDPLMEDDAVQTLRLVSETLISLTIISCGISDVVIDHCHSLTHVEVQACRILKMFQLHYCPALKRIGISQCPKLLLETITPEVVSLVATRKMMIYYEPCLQKYPSPRSERAVFSKAPLDQGIILFQDYTSGNNETLQAAFKEYLLKWMEVVQKLYYSPLLAKQKKKKTKSKELKSKFPYGHNLIRLHGVYTLPLSIDPTETTWRYQILTNDHVFASALEKVPWDKGFPPPDVSEDYREDSALLSMIETEFHEKNLKTQKKLTTFYIPTYENVDCDL